MEVSQVSAGLSATSCPTVPARSMFVQAFGVNGNSPVRKEENKNAGSFRLHARGEQPDKRSGVSDCQSGLL